MKLIETHNLNGEHFCFPLERFIAAWPFSSPGTPATDDSIFTTVLLEGAPSQIVLCVPYGKLIEMINVEREKHDRKI